MNIFDILYTILIGPLKLLFEIIFSISYYVTGSPGLAIIALSLVMNILLLPLYNRADKIQEEENQIQARMKDGVDHIKKAFKGDEQYFILNTYYRQNGYKPIYALRNSISLLLEIPFFIAAYDFLSNLQLLNVSSFGVIGNLGAPDGLLGGINLLPILMTLINILSSIIYTKGRPFRDNIQLYVLAILFLILLYDRPSGLVLYWTLNNLFSLGKNVVGKIKNKGKILSSIIFCLCVGVLILLDPSKFALRGKIMVYGLTTLLMIFSLAVYFGWRIKLNLSHLPTNNTLFLLCTIYLFVLTGLLIPNSVIGSSPEEFISRFTLVNPLRYVFSASLLSFGLFVIWLNVFYILFEGNLKKILNVFVWVLTGVFTLCYLFFNNRFGTMSNTLLYDTAPAVSLKDAVINLVLVGVLTLAFTYIWARKIKYLKNILIIMCVSSLLLSLFGIYKTNLRAKAGIEKIASNIDNDEKVLPLSKTEKNVVVLMLDRAISPYFPYILHERPELMEKYAGFTFYPNTISFGPVTNIGAPGLFGGYEYIPEEMNRRDKELLVEKHNEALKVMPVIFNENDYRVVVCDPPYAGYTWIPDLSIYDDYEGIKAYMTEGKFLDVNDHELDILDRNLFVYSLSRVCPSFLFSILYDNGNYLNLNVKEEDENEKVRGFRNWFDTISHFSYMTYFTDDSKGSFLMIQNSAPHEPLYLSGPDYTIDNKIDQTREDVEKTITSIYGETKVLKGREQVSHYDVNAATMIELGKWLDYLRENDVYDNTRIIIASDHGRNLYLDENMTIEKTDLLLFTALYLVKDFDSNEFAIDKQFMTNADTPYIAMNGLIENMENPFTGKQIFKEDKSNKTYNVYESYSFDTSENNGYTFINDGSWLTIHDDCLDIKNWKRATDIN